VPAFSLLITMNTIYKYTLAVKDYQAIPVQQGAQIISAALQGTNICIWAIVDNEAQLEHRVIEIVGTGHPMSRLVKERRLINTVIAGAFVWHVFEVLVCTPSLVNDLI
jgi:hypothetical protein